uniref:hypothetical protein n=1 Tax=Clostridium sp. NkU-1 TaxID=1095009 RepID=UPI000AE3667E
MKQLEKSHGVFCKSLLFVEQEGFDWLDGKVNKVLYRVYEELEKLDLDYETWLEKR